MYIRTDEGHIYERIEQRILKCVYFGGEQYRHNLNSKWENIIDQADTIEELCDEFVGVDKTCENGHQLLRAIPYKCANFWNGGVYGAIWTDKGLQFVARINSKGELELL